MVEEHTPVLIVGGGLVGLSTATFLAWHGVRPVVVERRPGTLLHPRARAINPRSVELLRGVGLEATILANTSRVYDEHSQIIRAPSLAAPETGRTPMTPPRSADGATDVSPCPWAPIDQDRLEVLLRAHAEGLGADIRFSTTLTSFEPAGEGGVLAKIEDGHGARAIRADYVVAADGHRSMVRRHLQVGAHGPGVLGTSVNFVFTADLTGPMRGRNLGVGHFDEPRPGTVLLPHDGAGRWVLGIPFDPDSGETLGDFTPERCARMARAAIGVPDAEVEIVPQLGDGTTVLTYEVEAKVTDRFREGPVFFAGDAAHVFPPTGAFGASTGIADAHNLAGKLAAVIQGQASPALLDSYDAERRPVARFTMEQALFQTRDRTGRDVPLSPDATPAEYDSVVFGYTYRSSAVLCEDGGTPDGSRSLSPLLPSELSGQPGSRAPHVRIERDGRTLSVLDLFGRGPVLLAGPEGGAWVTALDRAAAGLAGTITAHAVGGDSANALGEPDGRFAEAYGIGPAGAVLVRSDGFVAWRSPEPATRPEKVLTAVLRETLSLGG
ncbi:FAD-dependent monooxygenase [Spirillospora sp. CA-294931]|uniref:FAD-dependent monooxygenase n=1 Tax=Spirillospora sp. CA-294931 TaxID=3240042 RepID=UPI003D9401E0